MQNKKSANFHYAQSKEAGSLGDTIKAQKHMKQAQHYYQCQKENLLKAQEHQGKSF
ncbi:hypothetical protein [Helicobacter cetorum]|uniref:Uncharacterized protein n=1 Tax=Helicobacter cetorum (strain ATCC BAA-429 / MIT 00-7128) TaxID=182217 RepID=I0EPC9_HELC0|nr:hypothetical protein [Helicobacter cetorum]AFI04798.1 hypothetical protein HCW_07700 [Helicobacter cetorum MIT 00-7128]